jgi:hypothetical protein
MAKASEERKLSNSMYRPWFAARYAAFTTSEGDSVLLQAAAKTIESSAQNSKRLDPHFSMLILHFIDQSLRHFEKSKYVVRYLTDRCDMGGRAQPNQTPEPLCRLGSMALGTFR